MSNSMKISPNAVSKKERADVKYRIVRMKKPLQERPTIIVAQGVQKGGIRRSVSTHQGSVEIKMTVPVTESFKEIQEMNDKALKLIARRA